VPGETARVAHVGGGQVDDHHVAARLERAERFAQPGERRVVQRAGGAHGRGEPAVLPGCPCPCPGHHDPPEVAWADPEVADGVEVADADEEDDDAAGEDDDVPLAGVLAAELAGRATAMAAAAAALARPAPAVTAASLVLPLRRRCLALASSASAGSRSGVMKPSSQ
jgi:hypothetical protein